MELFSLVARLALDADGFFEGLSAAEGAFTAAAEALDLAASERLSGVSRAFDACGAGVASAVASGWEAVTGRCAAGFDTLAALTDGRLAALTGLVDGALSALGPSALRWGADLMESFIRGIDARWEALRAKVASVGQLIRDYIGFSEPKAGPLSNFHTYAPDMMALFAQGVKDNAPLVTEAVGGAFDLGPQIVPAMGAASAGQVFEVPRRDERPIEITVKLPDDTVLARAVHRMYDAEDRRLGSRLAKGGRRDHV